MHTFAQPNVNPFQFQAIQVLNLTPDDKPTCKIEGRQLTVSATRGGDQIMITIPLSSADNLIDFPKKETMPMKVVRSSTRRVYKRGEAHFRAKLTDQDVLEMRELARDASYRKSFKSTYEMYLDLAKTYKIHYTTAYKILKRLSWKHLIAT